MLSLINVLDIEKLVSLRITFEDEELTSEGLSSFTSSSKLSFCGEEVGNLDSNLEGEDHKELGEQVASLLY